MGTHPMIMRGISTCRPRSSGYVDACSWSSISALLSTRSRKQLQRKLFKRSRCTSMANPTVVWSGPERYQPSFVPASTRLLCMLSRQSLDLPDRSSWLLVPSLITLMSPLKPRFVLSYWPGQSLERRWGSWFASWRRRDRLNQGRILEQRKIISMV
jgi:hypothetical protein